jgi:phosphoribosylformylglycinamidine (FGAM) synthase-like amidotransferase family enzyme
MKAGIVVFPGINRERDMAIALERSAGLPACQCRPQKPHGLDRLPYP